MKLKALAILLALSGAAAQAQNVSVQDAWIRSTVVGQKATGMFMTITAKDGGKLVGASSPVAGVVEVHEMKMDGGVMKMRAVEGGLDLPAGKAVELKPGGYHVMLMDLKGPMEKDALVPLTLVVKDAKGGESRVPLKVKVSTTAPAGAPAAAKDGMQRKH